MDRWEVRALQPRTMRTRVKQRDWMVNKLPLGQIMDHFDYYLTPANASPYRSLPGVGKLFVCVSARNATHSAAE
jgi:hypothetical protein